MEIVYVGLDLGSSAFQQVAIKKSTSVCSFYARELTGLNRICIVVLLERSLQSTWRVDD